MKWKETQKIFHLLSYRILVSTHKNVSIFIYIFAVSAIHFHSVEKIISNFLGLGLFENNSSAFFGI